MSAQFEATKAKYREGLKEMAQIMLYNSQLAEQLSRDLGLVSFGAVAGANGNVATPAPSRKRKAQAEDDVDDGGKKKRSARKLKDPNAPKRPASSYIFFQNEQRSIIKKENPQMSNQEVVAEISRRWGVMTMDDKEVYTKKSAAAKRRYEEEKKVYEGRNTVAPESPTIAMHVDVAETPADATTSSPSPPSKAVESGESSSESSSEEAAGAGESDEESDEEESEDAPAPAVVKTSKTKGGEAVRSKETKGKKARGE